MVKLTKIYTRGGDQGETGLVDGSRIAKHDPRMEAVGAVDEANSVIGLVRAALDLEDPREGKVDRLLSRIQNDLFDLGADLATPLVEGKAKSDMALRIADEQVSRLEREIDDMNARLAPLNSFILPGGSPAAAQAHLARAVARTAERRVTELAAGASINPAALQYINRLSDHLFVLARHLNQDGATDVLWVPGANRDAEG